VVGAVFSRVNITVASLKRSEDHRKIQLSNGSIQLGLGSGRFERRQGDLVLGQIRLAGATAGFSVKRLQRQAPGAFSPGAGGLEQGGGHPLEPVLGLA